MLSESNTLLQVMDKAMVDIKDLEDSESIASNDQSFEARFEGIKSKLTAWESNYYLFNHLFNTFFARLVNHYSTVVENNQPCF